MDEAIALTDVYDKSLNFLIGSGASANLFPTLALQIKDELGERHTLETLATWLEQRGEKARLAWLFMHYYASCIRPAIQFKEADADTEEKKAVLANYESFLRTVLQILHRRRAMDKRCNIFTTNYDGCFAHAADRILGTESDDFVLNDGARGFRSRYLQARNFNTLLCQSGVFERTLSSVPQVNLVHLHGSIFWRKEDPGILVDYSPPPHADLVPPILQTPLATVSAVLSNVNACVTDFAPVPMAPASQEEFLTAYGKLPIVNPTKWKFHETVFEEHYYQMLRLLSYELEKPGAVLITFGFSFADEHILTLLKRSLANPSLQVFVCCYSEAEYNRLTATFRAYPNVKCIGLSDGGPLDFKAFNERVFTLAGLAASATAPRSGPPTPVPPVPPAPLATPPPVAPPPAAA